MTDQTTEPIQSPWINAPATMRPDWLPADEWPELEDLRQRHTQLLDAIRDLGRESRALKQRFEAEDDARAEALKQTYTTGKKGKLPTTTSQEERDAQLNVVDERHRAARFALFALLDEFVTTIDEHAHAWSEDLDAQDAKAETKRQEAQHLLDEAEAELLERRRLRTWLSRTAEAAAHNRYWRHLPHADANAPGPEQTTVNLETFRDAGVSEIGV